jgi:DNA polymerase
MNCDTIREFASKCEHCELHTGRVQSVFSKGNPEADIMICGMCPGPDENKRTNTLGHPFIGRAGKVLDQVLEDVGLNLENTYITNVVKCFVTPGITLKQDWCDNCLPYFIAEIVEVYPSVIVTLGADSTNAILNTDSKIGEVRGRAHKYTDKVFIIPTYHPSYVARQGGKGVGYDRMVEDLNFAISAKNEMKVGGAG